jgi:hypothetical protein
MDDASTSGRGGTSTGFPSGPFACVYNLVPFVPPAGSSMAHPPGTGGWYVSVCSGFHGGNIYYPPVWIPGPAGGPPAVDPEVLARQAYNQLLLPNPVIRLSPTGEQLVNLPSWMWLDRSA